MIQIRIMGHKRRNHDELANTLKRMGFEIKEYIDTSDDYQLENNMADRHKGASENLVRMITDPELPDDNHGMIIMAEDDIIPCDNFHEVVKGFIEQAPLDKLYAGFEMRSNAHPKQFGQAERISPVGFLNTQLWFMPLKLAQDFNKWRKKYNQCHDGLLWWDCPKKLGKQVAPTDVFVNKFATENKITRLCIYPNIAQHRKVESLCDNKWVGTSGVERSSVWFEPHFRYKNVKWAKAIARYEYKERRVW